MTLTSDQFNLTVESSYPTPLSTSPLLRMLLLSLATQKHTPDVKSEFKKEYDYIIVGAGTAGSVVASRLSENSCVSVLLLEAGPPPPMVSDVPAFAAYMFGSNIDWNFITVPQNHTASGHVDRRIPWRTGKAIGGSTTINGGLYVRGNKKDYDNWADRGAEGWSYEEVLPYFKKAEANQDPEFVENGYHGTKGPIPVMKPHYESEFKRPVMDAAKDLGYEFVDPNGPTQTGFYDLQDNLRSNQRCSTAKAYLVPAENRTNLDIIPNAYVRKVIITNGTATGVLFDFEEQTHEVRATREVIISAGVVNTPKLLMLSGIGPKEELQKFNIPVAADLPVGKNLQDHAGFPVFFVLNSSIQEFSKKLANPDNVQQYIDNRTGPLASPAGLSIMAFLQDKKTDPTPDLPNYEIYFAEGSLQGLLEAYNVKPEIFQEAFGPYLNDTIMACYAHLLQSKSLGTITLKSTNPYDPPEIDPNYLEDDQDAHLNVEAMKTCKLVGTSGQMSEVVSKVLEVIPGCEDYLGDDDLYFNCTIRTLFVTYFHYCGTAKMGRREDNTTVVDHKLRVKGIHGLRVVDASVMPIIPSGNTATPTIMIAEKASDIIKENIEC